MKEQVLNKAKSCLLHVTSDLIAKAVQKDSNRCMIADAVKQKYPDAQYISVDLQRVKFSLSKQKKRMTYLTPAIGQIALLDFDNGRKVEPFDLTLNQGTVEPTGWKARHPNSTRKYKKSRKPRKRRSIVVHKERQFGLRRLTKKAKK